MNNYDFITEGEQVEGNLAENLKRMAKRGCYENCMKNCGQVQLFFTFDHSKCLLCTFLVNLFPINEILSCGGT